MSGAYSERNSTVLLLVTHLRSHYFSLLDTNSLNMGRAVSFSLSRVVFRRRPTATDCILPQHKHPFPTIPNSQYYTIMKLALFCSLAVSAAAFAPSLTTTRQSSTLSASFENELGAQKPVRRREPRSLTSKTYYACL
jgi:hypothetical protein